MSFGICEKNLIVNSCVHDNNYHYNDDVLKMASAIAEKMSIGGLDGKFTI